MPLHESVLRYGFAPWLEILLALLLEIAIGKLLFFDPVDWLKKLSDKVYSKACRSLSGTAPTKDISRAVLLIALPTLFAAVVAWGISFLLEELVNPLAGSIARILLLCCAFSFRRELWGASSVIRRLKKDDKEGARAVLSKITSKDTEKMNAVGLVRASSEECTRAVTEGGFLPLFFASLGTLCHLFGGPSLSAAFALGSVTAFAFAGAASRINSDRPVLSAIMQKLGNAVAFLPSRLFAVLVMPAAWVCRLAWKQSLQTMAQGASVYPLFSRGWTYGAVSGACGIKLGGGGYYGGVWRSSPAVGTDCGTPDGTYLRSVILLNLAVLALCTALCLLTPATAAVCAVILGFFAIKKPTYY